jgi:hypothetical protein
MLSVFFFLGAELLHLPLDNQTIFGLSCILYLQAQTLLIVIFVNVPPPHT